MLVTWSNSNEIMWVHLHLLQLRLHCHSQGQPLGDKPNLELELRMKMVSFAAAGRQCHHNTVGRWENQNRSCDGIKASTK